jgi:hypothetical protein
VLTTEREAPPATKRLTAAVVVFTASHARAPLLRACVGSQVVTRPLRLWCRYLLAQYHQLRGRLVIFDRYVYEAAALPAKPPLLAAKRPYFWFLAHVVPRAGSAVVRDVPGHVTYERKQKNSAEELESERRTYARLAGRMPSLEFIDAVHGPERVRAEITAIVWRDLASRWRGGRSRP